MDRLAGDVAIGQFGVESGILSNPSGGDVIGMRILGMGGKENLAPILPKDGGEGVPRGKRVLEATIGQVQVDASATKNTIGRQRLRPPLLWCSRRGRLTAREIHDPNRVTFRNKAGDGAAHSELCIIWMRRNDNNVHRGIVRFAAERASRGVRPTPSSLPILTPHPQAPSSSPILKPRFP